MGMCPDNNIMAAAQFSLGVKGHMPDKKARAAIESLPGAKVVRRALAALRNNTDEEEEQDNNNKEEQGIDDREDGFVVTQDDNTKMRPCTSLLSSGGQGEQRRRMIPQSPVCTSKATRPPGEHVMRPGEALAIKEAANGHVTMPSLPWPDR